MGVVGAALRGFGRALKRKASIQMGKKSDVDLKKIHDKFFDKSGMKQKGKDIVKEGLKGLKHGVTDRNVKSKEVFKLIKGLKK